MASLFGGREVPPRVRQALESADAASLHAGRVLRSKPLVRLTALLYLFLLHVWSLFSVLFLRTAL